MEALVGASREAACAHLLRHLSDPVALRQNALVAHRFSSVGARSTAGDREALADVRRIVRAAAEALRSSGAREGEAVHAQRQHEILLRCDLQRERHQKVAADLGLSLSQFYRERREARTWVAEYILNDGAALSSAPAGALDAAAMQVAHARRLREAGDYHGAVQLLQEVVDGVESSTSRLEVYCMLVHFLGDARRYGEIHLALQAARECFTNVRLSGARDLEAHRGRLEMASADYYWSTGDADAAIAANEHAVAAFQSVRFASGNAVESALAGALLELVHGYVSVGRFSEAHTAIAQAQSVIADLPASNPLLQAEYLVALGMLQTNALDAMGNAISTLRSALDVANAHHLAKPAVLAMAGLSMHAQFHGDFVSATQYIRECLKVGQRMLSPLDQSNLLVRMLELEALQGSPHTALTMAAQLREHFSPESSGWTKTLLFSAMAMLNAQDYANALKTSEAAAKIAARKGDHRVFGAALRIQAEAGAKLGMADDARALIQQAVDVLETHGSPYLVMLSYEDSSRITGNVRHASSARELRSSVFQTALTQ